MGYAQSVNAEHFDTSAKQNRGIDEIFLALTKRARRLQLSRPLGRVTGGGGEGGGGGVCRREHSIVALPVGQGRLGRSLLTTSASLATPTCRGGGEETERWWRWGAEKEAQVVVDGSGRGAAAAATSSGRRMLLRSNSAHARRC